MSYPEFLSVPVGRSRYARFIASSMVAVSAYVLPIVVKLSGGDLRIFDASDFPFDEIRAATPGALVGFYSRGAGRQTIARDIDRALRGCA
jgi:hypothetical protein